MSSDEKPEKSDVIEDMKNLEDKRQIFDKNIEEFNDFSVKLKDKMNDEDMYIETKIYEIIIEKDKMKNENEINVLSQKNDKMEKFLELLTKQYELEIKYIEQYCDYKSRVEKIGEKYAHVNFNEIPQLRELFLEQLSGTNMKEPITKNESIIYNAPQQKYDESVVNVESTHQESPAQRRHTITAVVKNPIVNENKNDIRQQGSLQDHLKEALSSRFQRCNDEK